MAPVQTATEAPKGKSALYFGQLLLSKGLLSKEELARALSEQQKNDSRLGDVLLQMKILSEDDVTVALAEHLALEFTRLDDFSKVDVVLARQLSESVARRFCLVITGQADGKIVVAMSDPLNVVAIDTIMLKIKRQIKVVLSSPSQIRNAIEVIYHGSDVEEQRLRDLVNEGDKEQETLKTIEKDLTEANIGESIDATEAPVIRFVDLLLSQAVKSGASDIHIEPQENSMSIRMRIDGILRDMVPPARKMQAAVITRVKILSKMDVAERRLPQDGRFRIKAADRDIDVRVSVLPTIYGEKVVMRILDPSAVTHDIDKLGFDPKLLTEFKTVLEQPHGIIVVTGPTGSGKTTTLYAVLNYLKNPTKNITTVEDPVEYRLKGINQIQVKPEIDLDFASSLRAILRQDPDIILVGEIRDKETVEVAIKASLTGHLVLSTFHTNDAPSAVSRFIYMGIEPYLLASTLNLIVAQRLVRRICEYCKKPVILNEKVLRSLKLDPQQVKDHIFYHGTGCKSCGGTGYKGRLPIFEFFILDNDLREKVTSGANEAQLRALSRQKGYGGLLESGVTGILNGLTTAEEVLSVTFKEDVREL